MAHAVRRYGSGVASLGGVGGVAERYWDTYLPS